MSEVVEHGRLVVQVFIGKAHRPEAGPPQDPIPAPITLDCRRCPVGGEAIELNHQKFASGQMKSVS